MFGQSFRHQTLLNTIAAYCWLSFLILPANAGEITLVPYRAVYDVELDKSAPANAVVGTTGRMVYELRGSECLGFTARSRSIMKTIGKDASEQLVDKQVETFEAPSGDSFTFNVKTYTDGALSTELEGSATKINQSIDVKLRKPNHEKFHLSSGNFISVEAKKLINEALNNRHIYNIAIYDPSIEATKVTTGTAFIGDLTQPQARKPKSDRSDLDKLLSMPFWPVTISYYDDQANPDGLPMFSVSFHLYQNGVVSDIRMDRGGVAIRTELKTIEFLKQDPSALSCLDKR